MQYQIINTCGTSVLTNPARNDEALTEMLTKYSNAKNSSDIPKDVFEKVQEHWGHLIEEWGAKSEDEARHSSAEINCLLTWQRKNKIENKDCFCYLIHTDTVFGDLAAQLVEEWLVANKYQGVQLQKIESLNTDNLLSFENGLSHLAKWAFELKNSDTYSQFIFNIAGGFKSVSGFTQVLGTFLADTTIYKFEGGNEVLEVPKLPIVWEETEAIRDNFDLYRKVSLGIPLDTYSMLNPLWVKNGRFTPWGQIAWENAKQITYKERVFRSVYEDVEVTDGFMESVENLKDGSRIWLINERIDDLIAFKMSNGKHNFRRLDYKRVLGSHPYTHECDAWADGSAKRIYCNEREGKIFVEVLGNSLH